MSILDPHSTYQRYKHDTLMFTTWLVETGRKCGYEPKISEIIKQSNPPLKSARLKSHARKESRSSSAGTISSKQAGKQYLVDLDGYKPLARAIVNAKQYSIEMPKHIFLSGQCAISIRKKHAAKLQNGAQCASVGKGKAKANHDHAYFVQLLEELLEILKPCVLRNSGIGELADRLNNENQFTVLTVEDPVVMDVASAYQSPTKHNTYEPDIACSEEETQTENVFVLDCLFGDLNNLFDHLKGVWIKYKDKKLSSITASVITNKAFRLARQTEDEILEKLSGDKDHRTLPRSFTARDIRQMDQITLEHGERTNVKKCSGSRTSFTPSIFSNIHHILSDSFNGIPSTHSSVNSQPYFDGYKPRADRAAMSDEAKRAEDAILVRRLVSECHFIACQEDQPGMNTDELTRGICQMSRTSPLPIWLIFAVTVFLEIHHILRDKVYLNFEELMSRAKLVKAEVGRHFNKLPENFRPDNDSQTAELQEILHEFISHGNIFSLGEHTSKREGWGLLAGFDKFRLYKHHPILCGILEFQVLVDYHRYGRELVSTMCTGILPAHLYNILQQGIRPVSTWPMMKDFLKLHSESSIFFGARSTTLAGCRRHMFMTMGVSSVTYAPNRHRSDVVFSSRGVIALKENTPIAILSRRDLKSGFTAKQFEDGTENVLNKDANDAMISMSKNSRTLQRHLKRINQLDIVKFLEILEETLPLELPALEFNYYYMHRQAMRLYDKLRLGLWDELSLHLIENLMNQSTEPLSRTMAEEEASSTLTSETTLHHLGAMIISAFDEDAPISEAGAFMCPVLYKACGVFDEWIQAEESWRESWPDYIAAFFQSEIKAACICQ